MQHQCCQSHMNKVKTFSAAKKPDVTIPNKARGKVAADLSGVRPGEFNLPDNMTPPSRHLHRKPVHDNLLLITLSSNSE